MKSRTLVATLALALAACASLPRLAAPEVVSAEVRMADIRLPAIRLDVDLELRNPNPVDVSVASLDVDLEVGGERAGGARIASPVTLPASGSSHVLVQAAGDASIVLAGVARAMGGARPLDYALRGTLVLADGTAFPFVRRGQVSTGTVRR
jgi:LEA14-like dessication related protein